MNTDTMQLLYDDAYAVGDLQNLTQALAQALERHGALICSAEKPIPGLPCMPATVPAGTYERVYEGHHWVTKTPWGPAQILYPGDPVADLGGLGSLGPFFRLAAPADAEKLPAAQVPESGYAVLDSMTGLVAVLADAGGEPATVRVPSDMMRADRSMLMLIRYELAQAGIPILPVRLFLHDSLPYPWDATNRGDLRTVHAANDEVRVPVVGYVIDCAAGEPIQLVYLHVVGAKSAVRSIWATISNGGNPKPVSLSDPGDAAARHWNTYGTKCYTTYSTPVVAETGDYRLLIVDRRATGQEVLDRAYLVVGKDQATGEDDLHQAFAARLNAVLPIPILPEWGKRLYQAGLGNELVRPLICGGDVSAAYAIVNDPRWLEVVESLLQSGELAL